MKNHSDVLIIGGGIIGLACAHYLLKEGRKIRILEKNTVFSGASQGNCGLIFSSHLLPLCSPGIVLGELSRMMNKDAPIHLELKPDIKRWWWLSNFIRNCNHTQLIHAIKSRESILRNSRFLYEALFSENSLDCDRETNGILMVFKGQEAMEKYGSNQWFADNYHLGLRPLIGNQLYDLEPSLKPGLYGGWLYENDTHLRPDMLGTSWKNHLLGQGIQIEENCLTMGFKTEGNRIKKVVTSKGIFAGDTIVMAAGAWSPQFERQLKLKIPIQPAKGYSITMNLPDNSPNIPCYFYEKRVVATPWKSGIRLGGIMELTGRSPEISPERIQNMKDDAEDYISTEFSDSSQRNWAGLRPLTVDDLPIIDRSPQHQNLILAAGHGTTGLSMAPSTGKLVAELITGKSPHLNPKPFSILRFQ